MKKILIVLAFLILGLTQIKSNNEELITIPKDSIRVRIIANSNSINDQNEKNVIKKEIQMYLEELLKDSSSKEETKKIIESNIKGINSRIKNTINKMGTNTIYKVNYGNNFFPKKEYNGVSYESGFYESLVITLGEGKGNNWWCVLFPPLCLIDEDDNSNQTEYKLYISEIIEKYN